MDVSPELYATLRKNLHDLTQKWLKMPPSAQNRCYGDCANLKGDLTGVGHTACHSWVTSMHCRYGASQGFFILNSLSANRSGQKSSKEAYEAMILWLSSEECPLSQYVINRHDRESLLNDGMIIYKSEKDGASLNEAMWLCKVMRYGIEAPTSLDVWLELRKSGVQGMFALLVATYLHVQKDTKKGAVFGYNAPNSHSSVFSAASPGSLKNIFDPKPDRRATNTCDVFLKKDGYYDNIGPKVSKFCVMKTKDDGWGGVIEVGEEDSENIIKNILSWQKKLGGDAVEGMKFMDVESRQTSIPGSISEPIPDFSKEYLNVDF